MSKLDILNRKPFVENVIKLIENISSNKKTMTFAIDGEWGCGKSFVLDMLEDELNKIKKDEDEKNNKYLIIRYNCWKYDYYEEPLVAIVAAILESIENNNLEKEQIKGVLKATGTILLSMAANIAKDKTGVDLPEIFEELKNGIKTGNANYNDKKSYDVYFKFNDILKKLQKALNDLGKEYTVVFIVDELDRCLPEYSIKVLERLHHLTEGTSNIISIISTDKPKFHKSIKTLGFRDATEYLKKFIQFEVKLDKGEVSEKITDKYSDYISLFDKDLIKFNDSIEEFIQAIFKNISAREQEHLIDKAMLVHKMLFTEPKDYAFMCIELLIVITQYCYKSNKMITDWFREYIDSNPYPETAIPFSGFLKQKFKAIPNQEIQSFPPFDEIVFRDNSSLYFHIAYIWFNLFLKEHCRKGYEYRFKAECQTKHIDKSIPELELFSDTIKIIK